MLQCQALKFNEFGPKHEDTGYDGSSHWKVLHDEVKSIKCDFCKDKGIKLMSGLHDSVNAHLGKPLFKKANSRLDNLEFLLKHVAWSVQKYKPGLKCELC